MELLYANSLECNTVQCIQYTHNSTTGTFFKKTHTHTLWSKSRRTRRRNKNKTEYSVWLSLSISLTHSLWAWMDGYGRVWILFYYRHAPNIYMCVWMREVFLFFSYYINISSSFCYLLWLLLLLNIKNNNYDNNNENKDGRRNKKERVKKLMAHTFISQ